MRVEPDLLARQLAESGQLGSVAADVMRSKAMDIIARRAKVTDEAGNAVSLEPPVAAADDAASDDDSDAAGDTSE
jgi:trigger factor